jgi:polygalacturonase
VSALSRRKWLASAGAGSVAAVLGAGLGGCATGVPVELLKPVSWARTRWAQADAIVRAIRRPRIPARTFAVPAPPAGREIRGAIVAAIAQASAAGGGRVVVPPGSWTSDGPIHLASRIELQVPRGATITFSGNHDAYLPVVFTRWEGTECYTHSPFIYARDCTDVALTGGGTLNGQGAVHWLPWRREQRPDQTRLRDMGRDGVPVEQRVFGAGHKLRPLFVQFVGCERVRIEGLRLEDSPFWCVHPVYCRDVVVRGLTIVSRHINSDGVDPDSCQRVLVENCDFDIGDDGVAIKAGRDQDGWRVNRPCEDIVVRNCRFSGTTGGGMAIGSEMSGGVRRVFVDGWDLPQASHVLYFKANRDRGGFIEDVRIRNVRAGTVRALIKFHNDYHSWRGGDFPTRFRQVTMENVVCERAEVGLHISGDARAPVEDILIRNVDLREATAPMQVANARNVILEAVRMNGAPVPAVVEIPREQWLRLPN